MPTSELLVLCPAAIKRMEATGSCGGQHSTNRKPTVPSGAIQTYAQASLLSRYPATGGAPLQTSVIRVAQKLAASTTQRDFAMALNYILNSISQRAHPQGLRISQVRAEGTMERAQRML